ncbi:Mediator of RNA polymerase II transcription subunit 18 [Exophiala dermatitidis]
MHEFALYGLVSKDDHHRMLQQLAGYTRMQPQHAVEVHLVFKPRTPAGLERLPSAGGTQGVLQQDIQKLKNMLNAGLYYLQLVGEVVPPPKSKSTQNGDVAMSDANGEANPANVNWHLDFKDTPEPGKQAVSMRLISRIPIDDGDFVQFMNNFGYEYVSRYLVVGDNFYDYDTTLFVHKVLRLPQVSADEAISDTSFLSNLSELPELDGSGGYMLQASIDVVDGNHPELKERATRQLLGHKEALKQAVELTPGDRLALDTRLPVSSGRT